MGVIRSLNALNDNSVEDNLIDDIIDNIIDNNNENEEESHVPSVPSERWLRNRENRLRRNRLRPEPTFRALGLRGKSHKKNRRYANANFLSQQMDIQSDGEELNDISIYDFIPQTVSAFAQLLIDNDNMNAWNQLINCTEDQQNELLEQIQEEGRAQTNDKLKDTNTASGDEPSFNADQCFKRIDSDLKNMLKKKHIPLGVLASIEEEITDFFSQKPLDTYKSCLSSAFQRLLLHACCQYLDLKCLSFDDSGERWSAVNNRNDYFQQPSVMLTQYLETRCKLFS